MTCESVCPVGYYNSSETFIKDKVSYEMKVCKACSIDKCTNCTNSTTCVNCAKGLFLTIDKAKCTINCPTGFGLSFTIKLNEIKIF